MLTKLPAKGQITIPEEVRRAAHIEEGDYLEMSVQDDVVILRPRAVVPKAQAWFWQRELQAGEIDASEDVRSGRTTPLDSDEALLESLG